MYQDLYSETWATVFTKFHSYFSTFHTREWLLTKSGPKRLIQNRKQVPNIEFFNMNGDRKIQLWFLSTSEGPLFCSYQHFWSNFTISVIISKYYSSLRSVGGKGNTTNWEVIKNDGVHTNVCQDKEKKWEW